MASKFSLRRHCWPSAGREQLGAAWPFHATAVRVQHSSSRHGVAVCPHSARYVHTIINCSLSTQAPAPSRAPALGRPGGNLRARACKGNGKGGPRKAAGLHHNTPEGGQATRHLLLVELLLGSCTQPQGFRWACYEGSLLPGNTGTPCSMCPVSEVSLRLGEVTGGFHHTASLLPLTLPETLHGH